MAATTAAVVGIAATVAGTGMSFSEASKQRKAATTARIEADKAIQEARRRAEENVYKALSLSKEPYDRAREAALVQGAQAIEAGVESERGAAATAGRIQTSQANRHNRFKP
jgi:type II secretory pathway pseudopilin PulG